MSLRIPRAVPVLSVSFVLTLTGLKPPRVISSGVPNDVAVQESVLEKNPGAATACQCSLDDVRNSRCSAFVDLEVFLEQATMGRKVVHGSAQEDGPGYKAVNLDPVDHSHEGC